MRRLKVILNKWLKNKRQQDPVSHRKKTKSERFETQQYLIGNIHGFVSTFAAKVTCF